MQCLGDEVQQMRLEKIIGIGMAGGRSVFHEACPLQRHMFRKNIGFQRRFLKPSALCTQAVDYTACAALKHIRIRNFALVATFIIG